MTTKRATRQKKDPLISFLQAKMDERGFNQYRLAKAAGTHQSGIGRIMNGSAGIGNALRPRLCRALGITEAELLAAGRGENAESTPIDTLVGYATALSEGRLALLTQMAANLYAVEVANGMETTTGK